MAVKVYQGDSVAVAQVHTGSVKTGTATSGLSSRDAQIILTDEAGVTTTVGFTLSASETSDITIGMAAAWNAHGNAAVSRVTAASTSTTVQLTADEAGAPFSVTFDASSGNTTLIWTTSDVGTATTANSGPNDWAIAENWLAGVVPAENDDVVLPAGAPSILYGLNNSGTSVGSFKVQKGYAGTLGGTDKAYLKVTIKTNGVTEFGGSGKSWVDLGASGVKPIVTESYLPGIGEYGLNLRCTSVVDLYVLKGNVGVGTDKDDVTTRVSNFHVSFIDSQETDAKVAIGENVQSVAPGAIVELDQNGGEVTNQGAPIVTLNILSGTYTGESDGTVTTANVYGKMVHNSNGTIATLNLSGEFDCSNDPRTKTITDFNAFSGFNINLDNGNPLSVTITNGIDFEQCGFEDGTIKAGKNFTMPNLAAV